MYFKVFTLRKGFFNFDLNEKYHRKFLRTNIESHAQSWNHESLRWRILVQTVEYSYSGRTFVQAGWKFLLFH